ncbi:MAG: FAD-dependent thymidylate synthase [Elusimicrobia bacterium]|nr:FAD-dependent thymidylate synthase [Elusimicrobiota bacterium]
MKVQLIKHTPEPEKTCALAGRLCYSALSIEDLSKKVTPPVIKDILSRIIRSGHVSVLEHASFTFAIEGVSRALLAQLTRHRIASYSVQSQRYVKFNGPLECVVPPRITADKRMAAVFATAVKRVKSVYDSLAEAGIPAEDARYILPQASATKIILTMNARELRHFFSLRCCNRAQWEIKDMACRMLKAAVIAAPILFADAGPDCRGAGCHEDKPCGTPWKKLVLR